MSNFELADFDEANRVQVDLAKVDWVLLPEFMAYGMEFYRHMEQIKAKNKESEQLADELDEEVLLKGLAPAKKRKRQATEKLKFTDPW